MIRLRRAGVSRSRLWPAAVLAGVVVFAAAVACVAVFGFAAHGKRPSEIVFFCNDQVICGVDPDGSDLRVLVNGRPSARSGQSAGASGPPDAPCSSQFRCPVGPGPAISRDQKHIAWLDNNGDLWVARSDGSHPRQILVFQAVRALVNPAYLTWNPDNDQIAFIGGDAIYEVNEDGTGLHRLVSIRGRTYLSYAEGSFDFSPDGKRLVFQMGSCWAKGTDAVSAYVATLGTTPVVMRPTVVFTHQLGWHLIWVSPRAHWLTVPGPHCNRDANVPIWSSQGLIAFYLTVVTPAADHRSLLIVDPDKWPRVFRTIRGGFAGAGLAGMSFSPDGSKLVVGLGDPPQLAIASLAGHLQLLSVPFVASPARPSWGG